MLSTQVHSAVIAFALAATAVGGAATATASTGTLEGTLNFSRRRPNQPVVVFLQRKGGELPFDIPKPLIVNQKGAQFSPPFAVMVVGQEAIFLNDETKAISHNVYFLGATELDLGIFPRGERGQVQFSQPGRISVHCSIHKFMDAKIFVAPNPSFALIGGKDSKFRIEKIPAGDYLLRTFQKQKRFRDAELMITIEAGKTARATVEMKR